MELQEINDASKEVLEILKNTADNINKKIPERCINALNKLAESSQKNVNINLDKKLVEQDISEEAKDLIALLYYTYIADEEEKKRISKRWEENEEKYEHFLKEKYSYENLFNNKPEEKQENEKLQMIQVEKTNIFKKILNKVRDWFKK